MKLLEMPQLDRPREKLIARGSQSLTDHELLQVVIGSGVAGADVTKIAFGINALLDKHGYQLSVEQLEAIPGVSMARATRLIALFELASRRMYREAVVDCPAVAVSLVPELRTLRQEHLVCLSLDGAKRLIQKRTISIGTLNRSLVHPREVYADSVADRAAGVILIHNHPSGIAMPSPEDSEITERLRDAGEILGVTLIDHIIITANSHYSFSEAE